MPFPEPFSAVTALASIPSPPFQDLVIGPLHFRMYGLMIATGVLVAAAIARSRWEARGGDPEDITTLAIWAVPAGLIGARIYHVVTDFSDKYSDGRWWPDAFYIWNGGLGIPGGVLLGATVGILVAKRMRLDWRHVADAAAPAIPVAQAIGRLGNWFNQELYGGPTTLPWGLEVDDPSPYASGTTFHPTFLYEGLWNLALAGGIVLAGRRFVLRPGRWFAVYVMGYGLGRLWVESLRIDFASEILGLRVNTWISTIAIIAGAIWLFWGGNPIDRAATAELRAGGNPQAEVGKPRGPSEADRGPAAELEDPAAVDEVDHTAFSGFEPAVDPDPADEASGSDPEAATSAAAGEGRADPVGERRPDGDGPVVEGAVREQDAGQRGLGVDPQEGA